MIDQNVDAQQSTVLSRPLSSYVTVANGSLRYKAECYSRLFRDAYEFA